MSENQGETQPDRQSDTQPGQPGIDDEQLPEDLQPGEDNPLAEPLDDDVDTDDLDVMGGKTAEESDDGESGGDD